MARFPLIYASFSNKWWDDCSQRALKFILRSMYFFLKRPNVLNLAVKVLRANYIYGADHLQLNSER